MTNKVDTLKQYFRKKMMIRMMIRMMILMVFLLILIVSTAYGYINTDIVFDHLTTKDGLPNNTVNTIVQDNNGFMWFGTNDGLCKYDGYTFKVYRHNPADKTSISSSRVITVFKDKEGILWIGTVNGLNKYDAVKDTFISYKSNPLDSNALCSNYVTKILEDKNGNLWIGTDNGLSEYDRKKSVFINFMTNPFYTNSLSNNSIYDMCFDRAGNLWIGTNDGLNKLDIEKRQFSVYRNYQYDDGSISGNSISSILEDHDGHLWIGTYTAGINRYDAETDKFIHMKHDSKNGSSLSSDMILNIYEDREHNIWVSCDDDGGLNLYNRKTGGFSTYKHNACNQSSISNNCIYAIYEDSTNNLWVGNNKGGLNIYKRGKFVNYINDPLDNNSISNNIIHGIYEDSKGVMWIGTDSGLNGLDFRNRSNKRYFKASKNGISSNIVLSISEDRYGYLWFGTYLGGLDRFDRKTQSFKVYSQNNTRLNDNIVTAILEDRSGTLWVGTEAGGLNKYDRKKDTFIHYVQNDNDLSSISSNSISKIYQDKSGILWIGTWDKGICSFDVKNNKFHSYSNVPSDPSSLSDNSISDIQEDNKGNLWISTNNSGLNCFDRKMGKFIHYTVKDGLPSNSINNILVDQKGNLWLSTYNGLSKFNPTEKNFINFNTSDGLPDNEFSSSSATKTKHGELFLGTSKGMISFFPDEIKVNTKTPEIQITSFKIFDKPVNFIKELQDKSKISLSYKEDYFSFEFSALNYKNPSNNKYAYKMEGFDKDWIYCDSRHFASYTNLGGGTYTFRVKAANSNGSFTDKGTAVKIVIASPPWKTWWAYTLYLIVGAFSVWGYIRLRIRVHKRMLTELARWNAELEEKVLERTMEYESANEELVAMNDEIYHSNIKLSSTLKQLQETQLQLIQSEKLSALAQMVAGVAHEINTPVGVSITAASFLDDHTKELATLYESKQMTRESLEKYLDICKESIKIITINLTRAGNLVKSFKQLAVDQSSEQPRDFVVKEYMEQIILSIMPKLKNTKIKIDLDCEEKIKLNSYPGAISQVITNLIMNSLNHAYEDNNEGTIRIVISEEIDAKMLRIHYEDDGKGIEEENINKIFEPFFTTKRGMGGTGLGLNIVYNIVTQKLHGTIECSSKVNMGTTFEIVIPMEQEQ